MHALKTRIDNLQSNTVNLENRLNEIGDFAAHTVEFGSYTEEEKEALRRKCKIREFSEEEKQRMQDIVVIMRDLQEEKGEIKEGELRKRLEGASCLRGKREQNKCILSILGNQNIKVCPCKRFFPTCRSMHGSPHGFPNLRGRLSLAFIKWNRVLSLVLRAV